MSRARRTATPASVAVTRHWAASPSPRSVSRFCSSLIRKWASDSGGCVHLLGVSGEVLGVGDGVGQLGDHRRRGERGGGCHERVEPVGDVAAQRRIGREIDALVESRAHLSGRVGDVEPGDRGAHAVGAGDRLAAAQGYQIRRAGGVDQGVGQADDGRVHHEVRVHLGIVDEVRGVGGVPDQVDRQRDQSGVGVVGRPTSRLARDHGPDLVAEVIRRLVGRRTLPVRGIAVLDLVQLVDHGGQRLVRALAADSGRLDLHQRSEYRQHRMQGSRALPFEPNQVGRGRVGLGGLAHDRAHERDDGQPAHREQHQAGGTTRWRGGHVVSFRGHPAVIAGGTASTGDGALVRSYADSPCWARSSPRVSCRRRTRCPRIALTATAMSSVATSA